MIKDGYTRVSEIIGWYKALKLGSIDPEVLRRKTEIGTEVHEAIDGYYTGVPPVSLSERAKGYFESFKGWVQNSPHVVLNQEIRYYCDKLKITGAIDMIAMLKSGMSIIDFKTSAAVDKQAWELQAAFYHYLSGNKVENIYFIKLDKEGKDPKVVNFKPAPELWEKALKCYEVYKFWNE